MDSTEGNEKDDEKKSEENKKYMELLLPELSDIRGIIKSIELPLVVIEFPTYKEATAGRLTSSIRTRAIEKEFEKESEEEIELQKIIEEIKKGPKERYIV